MRPRTALAGALAALALPVAAPAAAAQAPAVQAVDGTEADGYNNRWAPAAVTIKAGETVTWSFAGTTVFHNVASSGTNWSFRNGNPAVAPPPASFTFATPGIYAYVCEIHATTMTGTVTVTDAGGTPPPPPPPPPPSEQPWSNDQEPPSVFEVADDQPPALTRVRVRRTARGARVRFRLSEPGRVTIGFKRGRRMVRTKRVRAREGMRTVRVRGLRPGRYRVEVRARDLAGNRSRLRRARMTVRA
jgi:plastocyanin